MKAFFDAASQWLLVQGVHIAIILVLTLVALKAARHLSELVVYPAKIGRDQEFQKRIKTLGSVVRYLLVVAILAVASVMVLKEIGIEVGPVLAAAGIVGLAVGFGAQALVQDVISGFFILLEDQIRVGDVVQIGDKGGLVERITLRMVVLRDLAGNVHYIRNGQIQVLTNMTKEFSFAVFDIGVAYREDIDEVVAVVREADEELRRDPQFKDDILEPIEILGLDKFSESAVIIKARTKTKPIRQWAVGRAFNRILKRKFDERGISIPYPHRTIHVGQDKQGRTNPLPVALRQEGD